MSSGIIKNENSSDGLDNEIIYKYRRNIYSGLTHKSMEKKTHGFVGFNISNVIISFSSFSHKKRNKKQDSNCSEKSNRQLREILKKELE